MPRERLNTRRAVAAILAALVVLPAVRPSMADEGTEFFEKKIRPVLIKNCYECHSASATEIKGGLRVDSREAIRKGGESGPAVVPADPAASTLLSAIRHESFEMPPDRRLPDEVIADFEEWIQMGAPDPRDRPPTASEAAELSWQAILETRRQWWSVQPVESQPIPTVRNANWSTHPIDQFILHKLEAANLESAEPADPRTLIRRLSLTLTGLPPTPAEVEEFLAQSALNADAAYDALVDRLLNSPHFGERWARHWMDVVRFTETHGNEWNYEVHHAWRYRDYLIRAFNQDVPYDRLIAEHIAGDLLPHPRWNEAEQTNESIIGTAFYRFGEVNHDDCIGLREIGFDLADNRLDTLTKAFQATTVACARCHDHKMDAVSTKDYYALLGILQSSRLVSHTIDAPNVNAAPKQRLSELKPLIRNEIVARWRQDAANVGRYLLAADAQLHDRPNAFELAAGLDPKRIENWVAALKVEKPALEYPLGPWMKHTSAEATPWATIAEQYAAEQSARKKSNAEQFVVVSDFRTGAEHGWKAGGQGLDNPYSVSGEFCIATDGDKVIANVLPAGTFTHALSQRLNGALRSPIIHTGPTYLSFEVMGGQTSALRLVSNNCQLNYKNYYALTSDDLKWITFERPEDVNSLRVYAELMTKLDNPKFPDQLGTLGGDTRNDRVPYEEAAADPRSYFGITRVVSHYGKEPPKTELDHLDRLFAVNPATALRTDRAHIGASIALGTYALTTQSSGWHWLCQCLLFDSSLRSTGRASATQDGENSVTPVEVAARYSLAIEQAVDAWAQGTATDADARWLSWLARANLIDNSTQLSPRLAELVAEYRSVEQQLQTPRIVPGVGDFDDGFEHPVLIRGEWRSPGEAVPRRYLEVLSNGSLDFPHHGSGRLELAAQITSRSNPLTARVMVNRIWHHLFGAGIVSTVDDFGHVGQLPSHPELLDHLAEQFTEHNWSIKSLIRDIVRTRTFRMASRENPAAAVSDPDNRLLHRYPARRLDAEAIRDSILFASGRLDRTQFGPSIQPYREQTNADRRLFAGPLDGHGRRSIYTKVNLMEGPKFLSAFNFPGSKVTQGRRDVTNVPTQALTLLNDPFVLQQSDVWAKDFVARTDDSASARIASMFQQALSRPPTADETAEFEQLVDSLAEQHQINGGQTMHAAVLWKDVAHVMFNLQEFIYIP